MKYKIDQNLITLEFDFEYEYDCECPNPQYLQDWNFIEQYQPYQYGKDSIYKIPLTKISLTNFANYYNINDVHTRGLKLYLNQVINYNYLSIKSQHQDLRDYQYQGIIWIQQRLKHIDSVGLFWEPRTGKTRTTTIASLPYKKIVVVSLAGQETNWVNNYQQFSDKQIFNIAKRTPKQREQIYQEFKQSDACVLVGSMNTLSNDILKYSNPKKIFGTFDLIIIDEIHKIKNFKTNVNKGMREWLKLSTKNIGLTGTPVSKNQGELLNLISLMYKSTFTKGFLGKYFFEEDYGFSGYPEYLYVRQEKESEWLEFLTLHFSKIDKSVALPWINTPEIEIINLSMNKKQYKLYQDCVQDFIVPFINENNEQEIKQLQEIIAQFTYLRQISLSPSLLGLKTPSIKQEWLVDYLENYEGDGIIIFSFFTSYLNHLKEVLKAYNPLLITGETKDKTTVAQQFQTSDCKVILANINAASKGITLDKADTIIFLDIDWRPDENKQAIERFSATTKENEKFRKVIYLQIADEFDVGSQKVKSMDKYMWDVNQQKISRTELIDNFKKLYEELKKERESYEY